MIRSAVVFVLLVGSVIALLAQAPSLDGTWMVDSVSLNGRVFGSDGTAIIIEGATYAQVVNGEINERGTLRIDSSKTPMTIDFVITQGEARNTTQLGIVELSGGTMKLHLNRAGATERPVSFDPLPEHFLIIASRR